MSYYYNTRSVNYYTTRSVNYQQQTRVASTVQVIKKVSTVTPYVALLDHYLFSTYNSITCVLRLMLSVHTHAYYEVRIRYGIQYAQHVACKLSVQREGRGAKA